MADPHAVLKNALDRENLLLVYQPIHDLRDGTIVAAEALLRQRRETGEIREASIITEAAEDAPAPDLFRLDSWLVKQAYSDAASWQHDRAPEVRINVNLSPRELQEGDVLTRLMTLLDSCGIDARKVNMEITETSHIDSPEDTVHVLEALKSLGLQLWLDDFGTGFSSLQHLQRFPLDGIKLPGSFVAECTTDKRCRAITNSIIELAHELGLKLIAEGVENEDQRSFLLDRGCEYLQGFLFSKPMPLPDFLRLVAG